MSEHTPGPWRADFRLPDPNAKTDTRREGWAEVITDDEAILRADEATTESIANCRIAAASLDLLEALEALRTWALDYAQLCGPLPSEIIADADHAIAKAHDTSGEGSETCR